MIAFVFVSKRLTYYRGIEEYTDNPSYLRTVKIKQMIIDILGRGGQFESNGKSGRQ